MYSNGRDWKIFNLVILIIVTLFVALSCLFLIIFIQILSNGVISTTESSSHFFLQEIHPSFNYTTFGFVKLNKKLDKDQFLSFKNDLTGKFFLISNFADSEYECFGSCVCSGTVGDERRTIDVITRPLFILFSALSSTLAFKMAENVFRDRCTLLCGEKDEISSQVLTHKCSLSPTEYTDDTDDDDNQAEFKCGGYCLANQKYKSGSGGAIAQEKFEREEVNCEEITASGTIKLDRVIQDYSQDYEGAEFLDVVEGTIKMYPSYHAGMNSRARLKFGKDILNPICERTSEVRYTWVSPKNGNRMRKIGRMCVAFGRRVGRSHEQNIHCKLISKRAKRI